MQDMLKKFNLQFQKIEKQFKTMHINKIQFNSKICKKLKVFKLFSKKNSKACIPYEFNFNFR
jgi:hypothetical protein